MLDRVANLTGTDACLSKGGRQEKEAKKSCWNGLLLLEARYGNVQQATQFDGLSRNVLYTCFTAVRGGVIFSSRLFLYEANLICEWSNHWSSFRGLSLLCQHRSVSLLPAVKDRRPIRLCCVRVKPRFWEISLRPRTEGDRRDG